MRFTLIHLAVLAVLYGRPDAAYTFGQWTVGAQTPGPSPAGAEAKARSK